MPIFFWLVPRSMKWRLAEVPDGSDCREGRSPSGPKVSCLRDTFWGWCTTNKARQAASQSSHITWPHDNPPNCRSPFGTGPARAARPSTPVPKRKGKNRNYLSFAAGKIAIPEVLVVIICLLHIPAPPPSCGGQETNQKESPTTEILLSHTLEPREKKKREQTTTIKCLAEMRGDVLSARKGCGWKCNAKAPSMLRRPKKPMLHQLDGGGIQNVGRIV